jgi:acetyltransferase-like isoleucine patch superfamily enzyme
VEGAGRIELGDDVLVDGKCSFSFAAQYSADPTLIIGSHTGIGHNCSFVVGRRITIGEHCRIASDVVMFDSSGHPSDPLARLVGAPAPLESVKPITLERNVWVGRGAIIFPGVTIGENSVVAAGAVVLASVPANSLVIGNPARRMAAV